MSNTKKRFWSDEDIRILKEERNKETPFKEIGILVGRNKSAVQKKAEFLGLTESKKWSNEENKRLKKLYSDGLLSSEISTIMGRSVYGIRMKISTSGMSNRLNKWTEKEISILKEEYSKESSSKEISKILGRKIPDIRTKASNIGIAKQRKYDVNDDYFSEIKTQKQSYWLGWMMSDGNIRKDKSRITLKLASKDRCVIEDFKNDLKAEIPIMYEKPRIAVLNGIKINGTGSYILSFNSEKIKRDLSYHGIVPAKTYTCEFPKNLKEEYYPGFIAGLISGDGSISVYKKKNYLTGSFVGTKELVESVKSILVEKIGYNPEKKIMNLKHSNPLYALYLSRGQTLSLYYWLKDNGTALMPRKNNIIEDYINNFPEKCKGVA